MERQLSSRGSIDACSDSTECQTLIDREKQFDSSCSVHQHQPSNRRRWRRWGEVLRITLEVLLCLLLLATLDLTGTRKFLSRETRPADRSLRHETSFGSNIEFMSLDHEYDELWSDEESAYKALVQTNPGEPDSDAQWGSIAMFHQLHCLTSFRAAMQKAREGLDIGIDHDDNKHWPHCFWYLRQALLCHADDQIELPHNLEAVELPNGTVIARPTGSINGANDIRMCRDSAKLYKLRLEHGVEAAGYKINIDAERVASEALIDNDTRLQGTE